MCVWAGRGFSLSLPSSLSLSTSLSLVQLEQSDQHSRLATQTYLPVTHTRRPRPDRTQACDRPSVSPFERESFFQLQNSRQSSAVVNKVEFRSLFSKIHSKGDPALRASLQRTSLRRSAEFYLRWGWRWRGGVAGTCGRSSADVSRDGAPAARRARVPRLGNRYAQARAPVQWRGEWGLRGELQEECGPGRQAALAVVDGGGRLALRVSWPPVATGTLRASFPRVLFCDLLLPPRAAASPCHGRLDADDHVVRGLVMPLRSFSFCPLL